MYSYSDSSEESSFASGVRAHGRTRAKQCTCEDVASAADRGRSCRAGIFDPGASKVDPGLLRVPVVAKGRTVRDLHTRRSANDRCSPARREGTTRGVVPVPSTRSSRSTGEPRSSHVFRSTLHATQQHVLPTHARRRRRVHRHVHPTWPSPSRQISDRSERREVSRT